MFFQAVSYTDQGEVRTSNQDSYTVKIAETAHGPVAMAVVCDGMGGLAQGEVASAAVVRRFDDWFWDYLPALLEGGLDAQRLSAQWNGLVQEANRTICTYSESRGISMGTTVTALLVAEGQYYLLHVGDCRAYQIQGSGVLQITADQTLAARELRAGRLSLEDFAQDPRQHILLQCVGIGQVVPDFISAPCGEDCTFLLCSDGFYHALGAGELVRLSPASPQGAVSRLKLAHLGQLCRQRGETDNLTAAALLCLAPSCAPTASMAEELEGQTAFHILCDLTQVHTEQIL